MAGWVTLLVWERWRLACWAVISWSRPSRRRGQKKLKESIPEVTTALIRAATLPSTGEDPDPSLILSAETKREKGTIPLSWAHGFQEQGPALPGGCRAQHCPWLQTQLITPPISAHRSDTPRGTAGAAGAEDNCPHLLRTWHRSQGTPRSLARPCYDSTGGRRGTWISAW